MSGVHEKRDAGRSTLLGGAALVWFGALAGVSMLATPVKFAAPSLTLPVALDVGRVTFAALNTVEIVAAAALLLLAVTWARSKWNIAGALLLLALVVAQMAWLLPALDARVQVIMDGGTPAASHLHMLYIAMEGAKLLVLLTLGIANLWKAQP